MGIEMKTVLITGANGFIGSHLVDFCITKNVAIYGIERPNQNYRNLLHYTNGKSTFTSNEKLEFHGEIIKISTINKNFILLECDIKNKNLLEKIILEVNPNIIFHFAAQPFIIPSWEDPVDTIQTNVNGTIHIFEIIKKNKLYTRVILAGTA